MNEHLHADNRCLRLKRLIQELVIKNDLNWLLMKNDELGKGEDECMQRMQKNYGNLI